MYILLLYGLVKPAVLLFPFNYVCSVLPLYLFLSLYFLFAFIPFLEGSGPLCIRIHLRQSYYKYRI